MEEGKRLRAAVYIRVSTADQAEMFGEQLQFNKIKSLLETRSSNIELAGEEHIYRDLGISGADDIEDRPGLSRMIEDLEFAGSENRPFDTVIVFKIDRFARKLKVLLEIVERLSEYGVGFISTQESIDTNTALGNAMLGVMGVFAELEREMIKERTAGGRKEFNEGGGRSQDKYGYKRGNDKYKRPRVYEPEAKVIRTIFEKYVYQKESIFRICTFLKEYGILIPTFSKQKKLGAKSMDEGCNRTDHTVRKILADETYVGKYYYNKTKKEKDPKTGKSKQIQLPKEQWMLSAVDHVPIIDQELFDKAQEYLEVKGYYSKPLSDYLLTGLLKCDACKEYRPRGMLQWVGKRSNSDIKTYQCAGKDSENEHRCTVIPLPKVDLERLVMNEVKTIFDNPDTIAKFVTQFYGRAQRRQRYEKQLDKLYLQKEKCLVGLENLKDLFIMGEGDMTTTEYTLAKRKRQEKLKEINQAIAGTKDEMRHAIDEEKYKKAIGLIKKNLDNPIEMILSNPEKAKVFLGYIIKEIVIFARDKKETDRTAGRKVVNQKIPTRVHIKFKLPQEFMDMFLGQ